MKMAAHLVIFGPLPVCFWSGYPNKRDEAEQQKREVAVGDPCEFEVPDWWCRSMLFVFGHYMIQRCFVPGYKRHIVVGTGQRKQEGDIRSKLQVKHT